MGEVKNLGYPVTVWIGQAPIEYRIKAKKDIGVDSENTILTIDTMDGREINFPISEVSRWEIDGSS